MGTIAKEILGIVLMIAIFQQIWVSCGGDPARVGAWEARIERQREAEASNRGQRARKAIAPSPALKPSASQDVRPAKTPADVRLTDTHLEHAKALGISPYLYSSIVRVSAAYRIPAGLLYGIKLSESGADENGTGGNCLVKDQFEIRDKWLASNRRFDYAYDGVKYPNGEANRLAIKEIAERHGYDWTKIVGSCGESTLQSRGRSFGGCITGMGINPVSWVADPEFRDKNPWDVSWALSWTAKRLRKDLDAAKSEGLDEIEALERAVRKHAGHWDGWYAWRYFNDRVVPKWQTWNNVHGVAGQPDLVAAN